ncbi:MAG: hypothetical protein LBN29_09395 [Mediterranea sp.]|jgi:hypothetical protein|nr:hypothetical protein [Mediterranea sp.]
MEEQIKRAVRDLNIVYIFFWLMPAALLAAAELDLLPVGTMADDKRATYYFETVCILLTAAFVPLSLKIFSLALKRKIDKMSIEQALSRYVRWSVVRLAMLELVVVVSLLCYYLTQGNTGNLCMLIGLAASFFCLPGEKRLRAELHIDKDG